MRNKGHTFIRRPWTPQDLKAVDQGLKAGKTVKQIATKIHRTEGAIRQKRFDLGKPAAQIKKGGTQRGRIIKGSSKKTGKMRKAA